MDRRIRVALVAEPISYRMGAERVVLKTAKYLARKGLEVQLVDPRQELPNPKQFDLIHFFGTGSDMKASLTFLRRARSCDVPCVVSSTLWPFTKDVLIKAFEGFTLEPAAAFTLVEKIFQQQITLAKIMELANVIIFTSELHWKRANEALSMLGYSELSDAVIVPNAVDPEELAGLPDVPWELRSNNIVTLARIELWKNHPRLVAALESVRKVVPDLTAVFIGKAMLDLERRPWLDIVDEASPRLGHLLLAVSKVHAMPSLGDFPGLSHLEAAALGCQILASQPPFNTVSEYLPGAILVDPINVGSITIGLIEALRTKPEGLRDLVLSKFTFDKVADQLLGVYNSLL